LDQYQSLLSEDAFRRLLVMMDQPAPTAVRLNPLKVDAKNAIEELSNRYGWVVEPVSFCPEGWILQETETSPGQTLEHRDGQYYIQDASSMLPVETFKFEGKHPELILDMAAAPGGKSTHLAARSHDRGLLVANDASRRRLRALTSNLRTWGAVSSVVTNLPGERLGQWLPGVFDKVLLDAPCSGEGLRTGGGSKGRQVSDREREALQTQQIGMLHSGINALKVGGELVYATCTAAPEENEVVIQALLTARPGQVKLEEIEILEPYTNIGGLNVFEDQVFDPSVTLAARLWPFHFDTGAFFTAKLIKMEAGEGITDERLDSSPPDLIDAIALANIHEQLLSFGFDLRGTCQASQWVLVNRGRFVHAVSSIWLDNLPDLPVMEAGLPVGRWQGDVFLPAHEWVTRFYEGFTERRFTLDREQSERWKNGSDLRGWTPPVSGGAVLLQDEAGRFLGLGSVSAQRVRNLLPRSWVAG
jgi:16S rRNA (cytosine1407-C5)-methyltransferase